MILLLLFQAKSTTEANTWEVIPTLTISAKQDCGVRILFNGLSRPLQKHTATVRFISSPSSDIPDGGAPAFGSSDGVFRWMENFPWWPLTMQPTFLWITDSSEAKSIWQIVRCPPHGCWESTLKSPLKITNTHSLQSREVLVCFWNDRRTRLFMAEWFAAMRNWKITQVITNRRMLNKSQ